MWAFEHAGIVPDVVCLAKAIANGLPLSAIVSSRALQERWGRGAHGSTYGGNPVACAAGIAVLETIRDEGLVANAVARGAELTAGLEAIAAEDERIGDVRGPGLMVGVEFVRDRTTREPDASLPDRLMAACADAGLLILTCGRQHETVRWIPPLDVSAAEIAEAVEIFGETLAKTELGSRSAPRRAARRRAIRRRTAASARADAGRALEPRERTGSGRRRRRPTRTSAVLREELHHVVEPEPAVPALADAIERQLTSVAQALHGVHVEVEHLGDFGRSEHRSQFVDGHRCHTVVASFCALLGGSGPLGWPRVGSGPLRGRA